jgi:hypothetical protein
MQTKEIHLMKYFDFEVEDHCFLIPLSYVFVIPNYPLAQETFVNISIK